MILAITRKRLITCVMVLATGFASCSPSAPPAPADSTPPVSAATPSTTAPIIVADAGPPTQDAAGDPRPENAAPDYSKAGLLPLEPTCKNPRAVLGKAAFDDPSLITRIRQAMAAHPEIEVTAGRPAGPGQLTFSRAEYGTKNFSVSTPEKNTYAVIARCADAATCLEVAAMVRAVVPGSKPVLVCGKPPAVSGGITDLPGPWSGIDALPRASDRAAVCARVAACAVRLASEGRDVVTRECSKARPEEAARCATMASCSGVVECWRARASP